MPKLILASPLIPYAGKAEWTVEGNTVGEALRSLFQQCPRIRSYVVDELGVIRHHVVVFVNENVVRDKQHLDDPVAEDGEIFVLQALSGG